MTFEFTERVGVMTRFVSDALKERGIEIGPSELEPIMADLQRTLDDIMEIDRAVYYAESLDILRQAETDLSKG